MHYTRRHVDASLQVSPLSMLQVESSPGPLLLGSGSGDKRRLRESLPRTHERVLSRPTLSIPFQRGFCSSIQRLHSALVFAGWCVRGECLQRSGIPQMLWKCTLLHYQCGSSSTSFHLTSQRVLSNAENSQKPHSFV